MPVDPEWLMRVLKELVNRKKRIFCPDCGQELIQEDNYHYCDNCGYIGEIE